MTLRTRLATPIQPSKWGEADRWGACPSSVSHARRASIFGTSATSRTDSAPACFSTGFCGRASPVREISCAARRHPVSPRSGRKFGALLRGHEGKRALAAHLKRHATRWPGLRWRRPCTLTCQCVPPAGRHRRGAEAIAVRAWLEPHSRRRELSSGKSHRSRLGAGWRGMSCFSCPSRPTHLPQRNHMRPRTHRCMVSCCGTGLKARGLPAGCLPRG